MIAIINGPNLNLVGRREPQIYGSLCLDDYLSSLQKEVTSGVELQIFQSNSEGELIDIIQRLGYDPAYGHCRGIVINPGAYAHYSYAIADALRAVALPAIEVHISNIHAREEFRAKSVTAVACRGVIAGLGLDGYRLAVDYLMMLGK